MNVKQIALATLVTVILAASGLRPAQAASAPAQPESKGVGSAGEISEKLMETDSGIVNRITYPAGLQQAELHHPPTKGGSLIVAITQGKIEAKFSEGGKTWTEKGHVNIGKVWYLPPDGYHQFHNYGDKPFTFITTWIK